jgi:RNA polymerase sigma factor (TIGR02999 family)
MANIDITQLLNAAADGMPGAADRLLPVVYEDLRSLARRQVSGATPTLGPTALVHEAWMRLSANPATWNHRGHFFGAAAQAMRRILVEHARARIAQKRGGGVAPAPLEELSVLMPDMDELLDLDAALTELEHNHPRHAQVVLLRYFAGLQVEEIARALEVSVGTVERDWRLARARLQRMLADRDQRST